MKFDYGDIEKTKTSWKVGDVIYNANAGLYLVSKVNDLDCDVTGACLYALINLETGCSSESYETIGDLQHYLSDKGDLILDGNFKYIGDDND